MVNNYGDSYLLLVMFLLQHLPVIMCIISYSISKPYHFSPYCLKSHRNNSTQTFIPSHYTDPSNCTVFEIVDSHLSTGCLFQYCINTIGLVETQAEFFVSSKLRAKNNSAKSVQKITVKVTGSSKILSRSCSHCVLLMYALSTVLKYLKCRKQTG